MYPHKWTWVCLNLKKMLLPVDLSEAELLREEEASLTACGAVCYVNSARSCLVFESLSCTASTQQCAASQHDDGESVFPQKKRQDTHACSRVEPVSTHKQPESYWSSRSASGPLHGETKGWFVLSDNEERHRGLWQQRGRWTTSLDRELSDTHEPSAAHRRYCVFLLTVHQHGSSLNSILQKHLHFKSCISRLWDMSDTSYVKSLVSIKNIILGLLSCSESHSSYLSG